MSGFDIFGAAAGAYLQYNAAKKQAKAIQSGANAAIDAQNNALAIARSDSEPYRTAGHNALRHLSALDGLDYKDAPGTVEERRATAFKNFTESPGYRYRVGESISALDKSAASRGRLNSGAHSKAIIEHAGNMASNEYNNFKNSLRTTAGLGQVSTSNQNALSFSGAGNIGNTAIAGAKARGSSYVGQANSLNQGLNNVAYAYGR